MTSGILNRRLTSPKDLVQAGLAEPVRLPVLEAVASHYAIGLTPALAALVRPEDPSDPIARQFVPDARELIRDPAERDDPIGDDAMSPVKGLVHRYPDRVLIKLVAVCAVYCRFCFRRERVGPGSGALSGAEFAAAVDYLGAIGMEAISAHERALSAATWEYLESMEGIQCFQPEGGSNGIVSFRLTNVHPHDVVNGLARNPHP